MSHYHRVGTLSEAVRDSLPRHAQKLYRVAFTNAWEQYDRDEARAQRAAWATLRNQYEKDAQTGRWKRKGR